MRITFVIFFLSTYFDSYCQQSEVTLSHKHILKIEKAKSAERKLKKYRKFYSKDSVKATRKLYRHWERQSDSIHHSILDRERALKAKEKRASDGINSKVYHTVYKPWAKNQSMAQVQWLELQGYTLSNDLKLVLISFLEQYFLEATQNDAALVFLRQRMPRLSLPRQLAHKAEINSLLPNPQAFAKDDFVTTKFSDNRYLSSSQYGNDVKQYAAYTRTSSNLDSTKAMVREKVDNLTLGYVNSSIYFKEFGKGNAGMEKLKLMSDNLQDSARFKEQVNKKAVETAMDYISENPTVMGDIQKKMGLLMKKYSVVPNSNDLSTATKQTSLKGRKFKERLYVAGNFQVLAFESFSFDVSPMIGYRFNTRLLAGIGFSYRYSFKDSISGLASNMLGYKIFSSYDVKGGFFGHVAFKRNSPGVTRQESGARRIWKNAAFVGIGRKFRVSSKIEMTAIMMYNFLHEHLDPIYPKKWNIKIGFQASDIVFLKK